MSGDIRVVLPLVCLAGGAMGVYLIARLAGATPGGATPGGATPGGATPGGATPGGVPLSRGRNALLALLTALVFVAALVALVQLAMQIQGARFGGTPGVLLPEWGHFSRDGAVLRAEPGALVIAGVALGLGALVTVFSGRYLALDRRYETYYPLLMLLVAGLTGMVLAADLFNLYLFCELMSLAAYALVSFRRHTDTAIEAGFKYLIMGSVGTVLILMGISFLYRGRGHLTLPSVPLVGSSQSAAGLWNRLGLGCVMVGLAIKSAIVPLHTWLPDAHGRAPSSVSAMLSGIVIQSALYTLLKVSLGLGFPARALGALLIVVSLLNMTLGNGLALVQTNTKRLLAYSTIAQMGYVMLSIGIGLRYNAPAAIQAGFFLLLAHAAMKGLAFLSKGVCHFYNNSTTIDQLRGTSRQLPLVAATFGLALAGLAGIPPLAGFAGKWFLLTRALQTANAAGLYLALAAFLLNNLVALGYFLPVIGALYAPPVQGSTERHMTEIGAGGCAAGDCGTAECRAAECRTRIRLSAWMVLPLLILGGLVLALGVYPGPWLDWMAGVGAYLLAGP